MPRKSRPNANSHRLGSIWIQPEHAEQLEQIAATDGRTISDLIRDAIKALIDKRRT